MTELRTLKVALLGCGNVGAQVARILIDDADALAPRTGAHLELTGIAVRNLDAEREVDLPRELFTTDAETLVKDADLVIELMGGIEPARSLILSAIQNGASVVTGNKALLAAGRPHALRRGGQGRRRAVLRSRRGRRHPHPAPHPRQPVRRPDHPRAGHRQRHHQLHPRPDGLHRRPVRRRPRRGPAARATPRRIPRPTSKASTPPPRLPSLPRCPSTPGSTWRTSTARASPASAPLTSPRPRKPGSSSSCWPSPRS